MPNLEAISNLLAALPVATPAGQSPSGPRALGTFASTLAVAQSQSATQPPVGNSSRSSVPEIARAGMASDIDLRNVSFGKLPAKKPPLNSPPLVANNVSATTAVVPQVIPVVMPLTASFLGSSSPILLASSAELSQTDMELSGTGLAGGQLSEPITGTAQSVLPATPEPNGLSTSPSSSAAIPGTAGTGLNTSESARTPITNSSALSALLPVLSSKASGEGATASSAPPLLATVPNLSPSIQWNRAQDASWSVAPRSVPTRSVATTMENNSQPVAVQSGKTNQVAMPATDSTVAPGQAVSFANSVPLILAQASSQVADAWPVPGVEDANVQPAWLQPPAAGQPNLPANNAVGNPSSALGIVAVAPAVLSSASEQALPTRADVPVPAPKAGVAVAANVRGAGNATATSSAVTAAPAVGPDVSVQSPQAAATPFSIFFSGPAPGTEAAAGALPKMILPVAGAAVAGSHGSASSGSNVSPQTALAQNSSAPQNGAAHNPTPQNLKDPTGRADSANPPASPLHPASDGNVASTETAVPQVATTPAPAVATGAVTLPVSTPPASAADALPKTISSNPPATAVAAASPEPLPAPVVGPVQMAHMVSQVEQSEMRIGMNTSAFGSVEVRAVVHANDVGLVVGSEKGDLRTLLSNELPAMANTLQEQNLRLHSVNFMQGLAFPNNSSGGGGDSQPRSFTPQPTAMGAASPEGSNDSGETMAPNELSGGHNNLSILA
jgi:hypothetical protein